MILIYTFLEIHSSDRHGFVAPGDGLVYVEAFDMTEAEIKSKAVEKSPVALDSMTQEMKLNESTRRRLSRHRG
jgi:hypothetical protein